MSLISGLISLNKLDGGITNNGGIVPNQISGLVADYNPQSLTAQATPGQIGNLVGWWRADQGVNLTAGKVSSWNDLSGNGNTLTQGTAGNRPTTSSSATYNNQAVINFASASVQYLNNATISTPATHTVFIVGNFDATSNGQYMCDGGTVNTNGVSNNSDTTHVNLDGSGTIICTGRNSNSPFIMVGVFSATGNGYLNCNIATGTNTNIISAATGFYVGIAGNLTNAINGSIAEVAVFSGALTQNQANQLSAYASQRYGITLSIGSLTPSSNDGDANKVVTQATFSAMPTLNTSDVSYNNQPSMSFSRAAGTFMKSGIWTTSVPQPLTAIVVGNDDGTSTQSLFFDNEGPPSEVAIVSATSGSTFYQLFAASFAATSVPTSSTPKVIVGVFNGASSSAFINGRTNVLGGNNPGNATKTGITFGATYTPGFFLNGKIARILIYNRALLQSEVNAILNYCGITYQIAIGN